MLMSYRTTQNGDLDESDAQGPCGICQRQAARYTCPRCNLRYCSLICYRDEAHASCSESFYKEQFVSELKNTRASHSEKVRMLEFLERLERETTHEKDISDNSNEDEYSDESEQMDGLSERLADLDIESSSFEAIWERLTPKERQRFADEVLNGDVARRASLLESWLPRQAWWESTNPAEPSTGQFDLGKSGIRVIEEDDATSERSANAIESNKGNTVTSQDLSHYPPPIANQTPLQQLIKVPPKPSLLLHFIPVLYAYAFAWRHMGGDLADDPQLVAAIFLEIAPLLAHRSQMTFENASDAIGDAYHRLAEVSKMFPLELYDKQGSQRQAAKHRLFCTTMCVLEITLTCRFPAKNIQSRLYRQPVSALVALIADLDQLFSKSYTAICAALADVYRTLELASSECVSSGVDRSNKTKSKFLHQIHAAARKVYFFSAYAQWLQAQDPNGQALSLILAEIRHEYQRRSEDEQAHVEALQTIQNAFGEV